LCAGSPQQFKGRVPVSVVRASYGPVRAASGSRAETGGKQETGLSRQEGLREQVKRLRGGSWDAEGRMGMKGCLS